jgi:hypothetical protein
MERKATMLADVYRARFGSGFEAYMALQRALVARWIARGGTEEGWCRSMAPLFRRRYAELVEERREPERG